LPENLADPESQEDLDQPVHKERTDPQDSVELWEVLENQEPPELMVDQDCKDPQVWLEHQDQEEHEDQQENQDQLEV